ncbi:MAG TPA: hypothetical protein VEA44_05255 [Caulobacter sp.]|nr:hypothetical protein [Caulobacter sp.]
MTQATEVPLTPVVLEGSDVGPWETVWTFGDPAEVTVWIALPGEAAQEVDSDDVTVTGAETLANGGEVEIAADLVPEGGWPEGAAAALVRRTPTGQTADIKNSGTVPLAAIEAALDRLSRQTQDLGLEPPRSLRAPYGETLADLPGAEDRAGKILEFDAETGAAKVDRGVAEITEAVAEGIGAEVVGQIAAAGASQRASVEATGQAERDLVELEGDFERGEMEDLADDLMDGIEAVGASEVAAVDAKGTQQLALIASARGGDLYATTAAGLSNGALAIQSITAGSGGTNGTFDAAISGGGGTGMAIRFVVSGGAVTSATILNRGVSYTSAPTISLAASAGLTGAAIAVTLGALNSVGEYFSTPGANGAALNVYRVDAGPVATLIKRIWESDPGDPQTLRHVTARRDSRISAGSEPYVEPYPLRMYMGALGGGAAKNANGTYALPAAATWTSPQLTAGIFEVPGARYCYVTLTDETTDAIQITIKRGGTTIAAGNTTTQPAPGVYKQTWNNSGSLPYVEIVVTNVSSGAVAMYPIEVYHLADASYFPQVFRFDDTTLVPETRRIIDWNGEVYPPNRWTRGRALWVADEGNITHAFDSVSGSDASAGTLYAPKQNLTAGSPLAAGSVLGLRRGSTWNQGVNTMIGSTTKGLRVIGYSEGHAFTAFPILDGGIDVGTATWTDETGGCWSTTIPCASDLTVDGYSFPTVVEITRADEAAKPLGSARILVPQANAAACIATPSSSYGTKPTSTTLKIYIHPTDGVQPSTGGTYKHKVSNLQSPMDFVQGNSRQAVVQNVEVRQGAKGLGVACGSNQSVFSGIIAAHGWTHTLHIEAGEVDGFVLYNRGATTNTGNCYITPTANGYSWKWTNGFAFACYSAFYSHAAAGQYSRGEYSYIWMINERDASGSLALGDPLACDQVAIVEEAWCYIQGQISVGRAGNSVNPVAAHFHHNLIRECGRLGSRKLTENFIAQLANISGASVGDRSMRMIELKEDHVVRKGIIYARNTQTTIGDANPTNDYRANVIDPVATGLNGASVTKTIFLIDTTLSTGGTILVAEEAAAMNWASSGNVFIFCTQGSIVSTKHGGASKTTIAEYLSSFPGHDADSLFVDLRDDPRGAKAVFMDPANGDFRWAQTAVAKRIKAYCDANGVGPEWTLRTWPYVPTVDEARQLLIASR